MDGKLMLVSNVRDMTPTEVVQRNKSLADIVHGLKVLKLEIETATVFHRLPEGIKAHASICFLALILYRVMRQFLKLAGSAVQGEKIGNLNIPAVLYYRVKTTPRSTASPPFNLVRPKLWPR
jgi:transposase